MEDTSSPLDSISAEDPTLPRTKGRVRNPFLCPTCDSVFSRIDHLSRHMRSHTSEKTFLCDICGRGFTRADSLSRHARGHNEGNIPGASFRRNSMLRVPMACQKCSASKLRCDGSQPCRRCKDKSLRCTYAKRSRRRVKEGPAQSTTYIQTAEDSPPMSETSQMENIILQHENMNSIDARALDALSQAALQARTPPVQSTDIDGQSAQRAAYLDSQTSSPGRTFLPNGVGQINDVNPSAYEADEYAPPFVPASPPRSNTTNTMDENWTGTETLNHMSFDGPTLDAHDDRISEISNIESLELFPLWDTTFNLTDWTTLEYDFHLDMAILSGQSEGHQGIIIGEEMSTPTFFDEVRPSHLMVHSPAQSQRPQLRSAEQVHNTPNTHDKMYSQSNGTNGTCLQIAAALVNPGAHPTPTERDGPRREGDSNLSSVTMSRQDPKLHQEQWPTDWDPGKADNVLSFPDLQGTPQGIFDAENFSHVPRVSQHVYDSIVHSIDQTSSDQTLFRPFLDSALPSLEALNCFVQLYFEHFQPVFPLLHQPTFDPTSGPWILILAVAAIGCRYSKVKDSAKCAIALEELLRRVIQRVCERDNSISRKLWLAQSMTLNILGMLYSGDKRLLELALVSKGGMVTTCSRNNALKGIAQTIKIDENLNGRSLESAWKVWLREESYRRLGFCCWLIDCQLPLYFDTNPSMGMHEVQQQLPCKEGVWEAVNGASWKALIIKCYRSGPTPNLHSALQALSNEENLSPAIGDFGRLVLTHAVYMTTWEMHQQARNPLLRRNCLMTRENGLVAWQNIAISTLDVLLPSNDDSGGRSLLRLNLRAHIHHVAVLVHVPLSALLAYARAHAANIGVQKAQQELFSWMKESNGRTARQAVLHAGILFSLIREQPCRGFHEPIALLVATLTLWVFHRLSQQQQAQSNRDSNRATVRLDRAYRTEAALSWIENGADLRGYLTDVGNICGPGAGKRLLQLSSRALMAMDAWTLSQGFLRVLSTLQRR